MYPNKDNTFQEELMKIYVIIFLASAKHCFQGPEISNFENESSLE